MVGMHVKVVGFDLDQTLYPRSDKIDEAIQHYIYQKIAEFKSCSLEEGERLFKLHYPGISGRKTLLKLGFLEERAENIVQEALENAEVSEFLVPNQQLILLLRKLKEKYPLALITGSFKEIALHKLQSLYNICKKYRKYIKL